jgi:hypothetical protein
MSRRGSDPPNESLPCVNERCPDGTTREVPGHAVRRWFRDRRKIKFRFQKWPTPSWWRSTSA